MSSLQKELEQKIKEIRERLKKYKIRQSDPLTKTDQSLKDASDDIEFLLKENNRLKILLSLRSNN